jgi:hypothetical protein
MMKSLAVFGFIFLLAASAHAALMMSVNGVIEPPLGEVVLQPNETAVIGIHGDGQTGAPIALYLFIEGPGWIDGHTMVYPGSLSSYWDLQVVAAELSMSVEDALRAFRDFTGTPHLQDLGYIVLADAAVPLAPLDGLLVDDIVFHCSGVGDVTLAFVSDDYVDYDPREIIHQIPEPMTLLLLGIGGLFAVARHGGKHP